MGPGKEGGQWAMGGGRGDATHHYCNSKTRKCEREAAVRGANGLRQRGGVARDLLFCPNSFILWVVVG